MGGYHQKMKLREVTNSIGSKFRTLPTVLLIPQVYHNKVLQFYVCKGHLRGRTLAYKGVGLFERKPWTRGGGSTLACLNVRGTCHYLGVPFFLKNADLSVSVFEIYAELWVPFEETCRIMGTILGKYCKIIRREIKH